MTAVIADTHTIIWYLNQSKKLSETAALALNTAVSEQNCIYVSAISVVEIAYLVERSRLPEEALSLLVDSFSNPDTALEIVPLNLVIALTVRHIPRNVVPEMPDRIIAATAFYLNLPLVTRDIQIQRLTEIQTIW